MHSRAIESAGVRLHELRLEEREQFALALVAVTLSLVATRHAQDLALPLFLGGFAALMLGTRALWRRWDLVDRLCDDRDAYAIPEVRARAVRETTMERRRVYASALRHWLDAAKCDARLTVVANDIRELADELEDENLAFEPAAGVACMRLVTDPSSSALLDSDAPTRELRSRILQIRAGLGRPCGAPPADDGRNL
jgi:hypothetical protein